MFPSECFDKKRRLWPWHRRDYEIPYEGTSGFLLKPCRNNSYKPPHFRIGSYGNTHLDILTKRAAFKNRSCVVAVVTFLDGEKIFHGSGTVIEDDATIVSSASVIGDRRGNDIIDLKKLKVIVYLPDGDSVVGKVVTYDLYFNIAFIKIEPNATLSMACLRLVDDYLSLESSDTLDDHAVGHFSLVPGEATIALGRYLESPHDLMAAPGEFSIIRCPEGYDCKELFSSNCIISSAGEGGPLINRHGEVIGVNFYDDSCTPFLPINIVCKWWNYYKENGRSHQHPALGMELTNFYAAGISVIEKLIMKFPDHHAGVFVEEVIPGSCADSAGIRSNDLIVECCGKPVRSFLQLFDMMWENVESSVELLVLRFSQCSRKRRRGAARFGRFWRFAALNTPRRRFAGARLRLSVACSVNA